MIIMGVDHFDWYTSDMMLEAERINRVLDMVADGWTSMDPDIEDILKQVVNNARKARAIFEMLSDEDVTFGIDGDRVTVKGFIDDSFRVITVDFEAKLTGTGVNIVTDELREYDSVDDLHNGAEGTVIGSIW